MAASHRTLQVVQPNNFHEGKDEENKEKLAAAEARMDASPFTDDVLEAHQQREENVLFARRSAKVASSPLDKETRSFAVHFQCQLATFLELSESTLIHMIALLDMLCHRALGNDQVSWLPGACVCIAMIVRKIDQAHLKPDVEQLQNAKAWFADGLRKIHRLDEEITDQELHVQERWVLQHLSWQIHLPTVETWLSAYCGRFDMATHGLFRASLMWVHNKSMPLARLALKYVTTLELQPQRFARGMLCSGFVAATLVSHDRMCLETGFDKDEWLDVWGCDTSSDIPVCALPGQAQQSLLDLLELALQGNAVELREDCSLFVKHTRYARQAHVAAEEI